MRTPNGWLAAGLFFCSALALPANPAAGGVSVHDFTLTDIDGRPRSLAEYRGKILLIVNVASKCGYT